MGLVSDLVDQTFLIIDSIDSDLTPSVTYQEVTLGTYDTSTDTTPETITTTEIPNAVLAKFTIEELRMPIYEQTDQKVIFPASSLGSEPKVNDRVIINSVQWNVEEILGVPGESLYILRIRET